MTVYTELILRNLTKYFIINGMRYKEGSNKLRCFRAIQGLDHINFAVQGGQ